MEIWVSRFPLVTWPHIFAGKLFAGFVGIAQITSSSGILLFQQQVNDSHQNAQITLCAKFEVCSCTAF